MSGSPGSASESARLLGVFFRAHRENVRPADVGVASTGRRRTPGLRREEVALLAGVGVAWYTWLEQGRVSASRQVLESIGRALQLSDGSFAYMLTLAGFAPAVQRQEIDLENDRSLAFMIDDWKHGPAFLLDQWFDVVAWNEAYAAVWGDPASVSAEYRNHMIALSTSERAQQVLGDSRLDVLRGHLGQFRTQTAPFRSEERVDRIYQILDHGAPDLNGWWTCQSMDPMGQSEFFAELDSAPIRLHQMLLTPHGPGAGTLFLQRPVEASGVHHLRRYLQSLDSKPVSFHHRTNSGLVAAS
ncbi:helix-turn-helix domain-containing protein [Rhodococcus sp. UFZ-B548]|uniref:helix-turn-helix domain-containing protein n=1 Tax=Rhodococcus sp. UFZ-B548 TaxID=2742212 RepID=UPI0015F4CE2F|nr:helix-turn-helix domain-containing protein [Rhodococcus sp. UFZ-B548]